MSWAVSFAASHDDETCIAMAEFATLHSEIADIVKRNKKPLFDCYWIMDKRCHHVFGDFGASLFNSDSSNYLFCYCVKCGTMKQIYI